MRAWLAEEATEIRSRTGLRTTGKLDTPFLGATLRNARSLQLFRRRSRQGKPSLCSPSASRASARAAWCSSSRALDARPESWSPGARAAVLPTVTAPASRPSPRSSRRTPPSSTPTTSPQSRPSSRPPCPRRDHGVAPPASPTTSRSGGRARLAGGELHRLGTRSWATSPSSAPRSSSWRTCTGRETSLLAFVEHLVAQELEGAAAAAGDRAA